MVLFNETALGAYSENPLRVGFIGAGAVAEMHHLALAQIPRARLAGFYDPDPALSRKREESWHIPSYQTAEALLDSGTVDAVFILSPVQTHELYALMALERRIPTLIEKPVAHNLVGLARIRAAAEQAGVFVMPGHNYIYNSELAQIHRNLVRGEFGRVYAYAVHYSIRHAEELARNYPGILRQVIPHHLYTLLYLGFEPASVVAMASSLHYRTLDLEDQASLLMQAKDGTLASAFASFAADDWSCDPWTFHVKILAEHGSATFSWRTAVTNRIRGTHPAAFVPYEESYYQEDQFFVEHCRTPKAKPLSTLANAETVERIIMAAESSISTGRIVHLNP